MTQSGHWSRPGDQSQLAPRHEETQAPDAGRHELTVEGSRSDGGQRLTQRLRALPNSNTIRGSEVEFVHLLNRKGRVPGIEIADRKCAVLVGRVTVNRAFPEQLVEMARRSSRPVRPGACPCTPVPRQLNGEEEDCISTRAGPGEFKPRRRISFHRR
jgi:hypothetical protein